MNGQFVEAIVRDRTADELNFVAADSTVADAVAVMAEREVGAVLVMTEDGLVGGIFTERDLLTRVAHAGLDPKTTPLSMVMTRDVHFVSPQTTVEAALALMHVSHYRHLLVIDGPRVKGLISIRDLAYQLVRHGEGRFEAALRAVKLGDDA